MRADLASWPTTAAVSPEGPGSPVLPEDAAVYAGSQQLQERDYGCNWPGK